MAKRRKRSFGLVKHSAKKIARDYWKRYHANTPQAKKYVNVRVEIERITVPTNTGRSAGYHAVACVSTKRGGAHMWKKCGGGVVGRTPTGAMKKALVGLGRNPRVK